MISIIMIGAGGFLGAICRYLLARLVGSRWKGDFPLGTFIVNITGSFLLGLVVFHPFLAERLGSGAGTGVGVGFLGAYTTFSTLEYETLQLLEDKKIFIALFYAVTSLIAGFLAAWLTWLL